MKIVVVAHDVAVLVVIQKRFLPDTKIEKDTLFGASFILCEKKVNNSGKRNYRQNSRKPKIYNSRKPHGAEIAVFGF